MSSMTYDRLSLEHLCSRAAERAGASTRTAQALAHATMEAESRGRSAVGIAHLFDYLDGLATGRIDGQRSPHVQQLSGVAFRADCHEGLAQVAFEDCYDRLAEAAHRHGLAMLSVTNAFTCGELGYYARRLAHGGLIGLSGANSPALMSIGGATAPVLGTNPLAFGIPRRQGPPLVVDQASSQTAFVNVRQASAQGRSIPDTWAVDAAGHPTTDPSAALQGALLPFGGYKGGNIALLVEMLAVLSGANWSSDAPPFDSGAQSPKVGMFVVAVDPDTFGDGYRERVDSFFAQLATRWSVDLHMLEDPAPSPTCALDAGVLERLVDAAGEGPPDASA